MLYKILFCFTALLLISMHSPHARAAETCQASVAAAAFRAGDASELARLLNVKGCGGNDHVCTGQILGLTLMAEADRLQASGRAEEARRLFEQATHLPKSWQVLGRMGDLAFSRATAGDRKSYDEADDAYEKAVNDIAAPLDCASFGAPGAPTVATIAALHRRMTEAKLLAPSFNVATTREGECGGVFLPRVRGFTPKTTQLPVEFESNSTTLTDKGEKVAKELAQCVSKMKSISLSGHADERGSDSYNMALSARRLEAIKSRLLQSGYQGEIILEPKGKREPFAVADPGQHSRDEIDQMNRRVELRGVKP